MSDDGSRTNAAPAVRTNRIMADASADEVLSIPAVQGVLSEQLSNRHEDHDSDAANARLRQRIEAREAMRARHLASASD